MSEISKELVCLLLSSDTLCMSVVLTLTPASGVSVGAGDGTALGSDVGCSLGLGLGLGLGTPVGCIEGTGLGTGIGLDVGNGVGDLDDGMAGEVRTVAQGRWQ